MFFVPMFLIISLCNFPELCNPWTAVWNQIFHTLNAFIHLIIQLKISNYREPTMFKLDIIKQIEYQNKIRYLNIIEDIFWIVSNIVLHKILQKEAKFRHLRHLFKLWKHSKFHCTLRNVSSFLSQTKLSLNTA